MTNEEIKKLVKQKLIVLVKKLENLSNPHAFEDHQKIGDQIKFDIALRNSSSYNLINLKIIINQMAAVEFEDASQEYNLAELPTKTEKYLTTVKGKVIENPNDGIGPYSIADKLCKVTVTGEIKEISDKFIDQEIELINIHE